MSKLDEFLKEIDYERKTLHVDDNHPENLDVYIYAVRWIEELADATKADLEALSNQESVESDKDPLPKVIEEDK